MKSFKKFIILLVFGSLLCLFSCNKNPLNQPLSGKYSTDNFWKTDDDVIAGIFGVYNGLFSWWNHDYYTFDDRANDIYTFGDHPDDLLLVSLNGDPTLPILMNVWTGLYEGIARANNAILYVPKAQNIDDGLRQRSLGEAYLFRGLAYFELCRNWGEVPIILESNLMDNEYNVAKSTEEDVRKQSETDLLKALDLLNDADSYSSADKGRVSKGTAAGLLCKLYMTEDDFVNAIKYGAMVTENPTYNLIANYADNFTSGLQEASQEILLQEINHDRSTPNTMSSSNSTYFSPRNWQGWGFHHPTQNLYDDFENSDMVRKEATFVGVGDSVNYQTNMILIGSSNAYQMFTGKEGTYTGRLLPSMSTTGFVLRKHIAYLASGSGAIDYNLNSVILRSSDIYLLVAEAKIRKDGVGAGDGEINKVRNRVGLASINNAGMEELMHERRVELAGEIVRWHDLVRWDKANIIDIASVLSQPRLSSPLPPYNGASVTPGRSFDRPRDYYVPVPQKIVDESGGVIAQNPLWIK